MKFCHKCGHPVAPGSNYCSYRCHDEHKRLTSWLKFRLNKCVEDTKLAMSPIVPMKVLPPPPFVNESRFDDNPGAIDPAKYQAIMRAYGKEK